MFRNDADNEIHAGAGDDLITGGAGNDTLLGQSDHDTKTGGTGNDHMLGGDGHDHLTDAWKNDTLSGGAGTDTLISHLGDNAQILQTTTQSTDTDTSSQSAYSTTSSIGEAGQIYVLERLSLGPEKRLSAWASETYDAQISLDHVLIDANGTIYGNPTPNPAAILQFTANGTAMGFLVYGDDAYQLESGNVALSMNAAQGGDTYT